jgi:hypothetical protein
MDYGGWYNIDDPEREFYSLNNCNFVAAMSRATVNTRYVRHFNVIYCEPYSGGSLSSSPVSSHFATLTATPRRDHFRIFTVSLTISKNQSKSVSRSLLTSTLTR